MAWETSLDDNSGTDWTGGHVDEYKGGHKYFNGKMVTPSVSFDEDLIPNPPVVTPH